MSDASSPTAAADPFDFTATVGMLSVAVGGTALAGGAFPIVMVAANAIGELASGLTKPVVGPAVHPAAIIILGGMVGFMFALVVGFLVSSLLAKAAPGWVGVAWQYLATILLYPFSHRLIERFEDADVRFR